MRWLAAGLLVAALALRLGALAATPDFEPRLDAAHYDALACGLVLSGDYALRNPSGRTADDCGRAAPGENPATAFRPPAWPFVLAGVYATTGEEDRWGKARVAQALVGTLAVGLIGLLASQLLGGAAAVAALALAALDTTLLVTGASLMSEPLFVVLVTGALCAAVRAREGPVGRWALAAGALLGLATLVRTNGLFLVPVAALLARGGWRGAAVVALGCVLAISPWTVRNAIQMDAFVPVASYFGTGLAGTFNETARNRTDFPGAWMSPRNVGAFQDVHHSSLSELGKQDELRRRALEHAADHPGYVVTSAVRNSLRMLSLADVDWYRGNAEALSLPRWTGPFAAIGFWVLLALALAGARRVPPAVWLGAALLIASAAWFGGEMRYRAPLIPLLILPAASLVAWIWESRVAARS